MAALAHRVRRLQWRARTRSERQAFALRAGLRRQMEDVLLPALSGAFDRIAPGNTVVRIPRLEIALRVGGIDEIPRALAEAVERRWRTQPAPPSRPASAEWRAALLDYLAAGALDWSLAQAEPRDVALGLRAVLATQLEAIVRDLRRRVSGRTPRQAAFFRLLRLLPPSRWTEAASALLDDAPVLAERATALRAAVEALCVLEGVRSAGPLAQGVAIVLASADARPAEQRQALRELVLLAGNRPSDGEGHSGVAASPAVLPPAVLAVFAPAALAAEREGAPSAPVHILPELPEAALRVRPANEVTAADEGSAAAAPALLALRNAGLVLLHPFLPALLSHCGLRAEARITDLPRAAALLHWLATGGDSPHEFELGFAKLLLGLRPEQPLAVEAGLLTTADREEGEAVLRAAVSHWKALGGTSIDGLRVSFLQRPGHVREDEEGWRLVLESEAFDVLVARLPWGIAMTRLPWMTRPLFTDWPIP